MTKLYNQSIMKNRRKELRRNLTSEERVLFKMLSRYLKAARFRCQYSVGPYILDFYSPKSRVGIELDGSQHLNQKEYDTERDRFLESKNILVMRFPNEQIRNSLPKVMQNIKSEIQRRLM